LSTDPWTAAETKLDEDESWIRLDDEGDTVTMQAEAIQWRDGKFGKFLVVRGITRDGEEVVLKATRSVLRRKIEASLPRPGDILSVRYDGERFSEKNNTTYHDYSVGLVRSKTAVAQPPDISNMTYEQIQALEEQS
jgi:hypothetical protein